MITSEIQGVMKKTNNIEDVLMMWTDYLIQSSWSLVVALVAVEGNCLNVRSHLFYNFFDTAHFF